MKDILEKRIVELQGALDQSAANHNAILGAMSEAKNMLAQVYAKEVADSVEAKKSSE
jgi:hypothetical protein